MITLMYVSVSVLKFEEAAVEAAQIVEGSIIRNAGLAVTGALLFTGAHFAQALEGNAADVDILMASISRDQRHSDVKIVDRSKIIRRRFANWQMAYQGDAQYVDDPITRLLNEAPQSSANRYVNQIYSLMTEFVRQS